MPALTLRAAVALDIPAVAAIYTDHVLHGTASFEIEPPSVEDMHRRHAAVLAAGLPYLVAERAGEVLGYAYATPYRPRPAYRHTIENSVYVRADLAGQGIGRALLGELIALVERGDWRQMVAVIGDSENRASIALHERLGFRRVGVFESVGFKHGRWLDTVLMQRSLGVGDRTPGQA
ncbi:GNAT family N-acetyltransferase [Pseudomonas sp. GD03944]|uniref:GNAT family N-acetyltransferase n=1 Tax=Pseudomonas sp. GD03944 TaxID=2975409 RepID=UPI00244CE383|nr:GNAT family N-acetyltransferase [Pseudomonas sp. GD03944]MDH1261429.1 GNAT family N-acetyltransferase [Pseudomonas sp. GD03944]